MRRRLAASERTGRPSRSHRPSLRVPARAVVLRLFPFAIFFLATCADADTALFPPDGAAELAEDALDSGPSDPSADVDPTDVSLDDPAPDTADVEVDAADVTPEVDAADVETDTEPPPLRGSGTWADPFIVDHVPFVHESDTRTASERLVDQYSCAPTTDESGAEVVYRVVLAAEGILSAAVDDVSGDGVDVDVHFLSEASGDACSVRDNIELYQVLGADDTPYIVADTWVDGSGTAYPGPYELRIGLSPLPAGDCLVEFGEIALFNRDEPLPLPIIGEVVGEAHLVTTEEFPGSWPTGPRDGIENHYAITQAASGYVMDRSSDWAPEGEGGSEWGQGSTSRPPPLDESWYVNMYWRTRPAHGTRMLVFNPANGRAVVAAGGYETGPGSPLRIGGACEEIHHHLDSRHRSKLLMAFLVDQTLPLGPIDCD